ncbi:hypothetical protein [Streptomyces roseolus]|uniref:hypothetical protein n=1 Tax=Streptomyces roseolus TaxID=67358 RepID=UPI00379E9418
MYSEEVLPYGERVVGFPEVAEEFLDRPYGDPEDPPHDPGAPDYHRLRGLILAQGTEIEAAMGKILSILDPAAQLGNLTFYRRIMRVRELIAPAPGSAQDVDLNAIDTARDRRNRIVHEPIVTCYNYVRYLTGGGGEWVPVLTVQGRDEVDHRTLCDDLALQQEAMRATARLWVSVTS